MLFLKKSALHKPTLKGLLQLHKAQNPQYSLSQLNLISGSCCSTARTLSFGGSKFQMGFCISGFSGSCVKYLVR